MLLVWPGIIILIAMGFFLLVRQQQPIVASRKPAGRLELPTLFTLEIGDIVQYLDTDWVVEGRLTYNDEGYTWLEYLLQDGDRLCWLSVEEDDQVEVSLLEPTHVLEVGSNPPQQLTFLGESYQCVEFGTARMTRIGTTRQRSAEQCRYFDYKGSGERVLSIEDWSGEIEVTVGKQIPPSLLTILPGDGRTIYGI
ncbi:MAG TPA: DUF4178 domain-containing protein [Candidatus Caenarcaniphilales bacterium]